MHDELTAGDIVRSDDLVDADSDLVLEDGEILSQRHVVLQDLQQQEQSLGHLVGLSIDDNIIPDDPEIAHQLTRLLQETLLPPVHQHRGLVHHGTLLWVLQVVLVSYAIGIHGYFGGSGITRLSGSEVSRSRRLGCRSAARSRSTSFILVIQSEHSCAFC